MVKKGNSNVANNQGGSSEMATVNEVHMYGTIGVLSEFKPDGDWTVYQERMEQYFLANMIPEERKVPLLITCMGEKAYIMLKDLCDPLPPAQCTYAQLCTLLTRQFAPKISFFRKREEFYSLRKDSHDSVNDWYIKIKNAAAQCKFGKNLNFALKDKFITGLNDGIIKDQLCEEDLDKELNEIVELALKKEATIKTTHITADIHKIEKKFKRTSNFKTKGGGGQGGTMQNSQAGTSKKSSQGKTDSNLACFHCGKKNHDFSKCKYKNYKCKKCSKIGHLAIICKSSIDVKNIDIKSDNVFKEFDLFNVNSNISFVPPEIIKVKVNGIDIEMELDSGATSSFFTEEIFNKKLGHLCLESSNVNLTFF
ncbi:unnamed protein product, partial [Aphis gossypii]